MHAKQYSELIELIRRQWRNPATIPKEDVRRAMELATDLRNFWARREIIKWMSEFNRNNEACLDRFFEWIVDAAVRRSPWTCEMIYYLLQAWPTMMLQSRFYEVIRHYPAAVARALYRLVQEGALKPDDIPDIILDELIRIAPLSNGNSLEEVYRLVHAVRAGREEWIRRVAQWKDAIESYRVTAHS